jgi:hypothetical protein
MARVYNMTLTYVKYVAGKSSLASFRLMVSSIGWGWEDKRHMTQTHHGRVIDGGVNQLSQAQIVASGRFYGSEEKSAFSSFVQEWQQQAIQRATPSPLRLVVSPMENRAESTMPFLNIDYLVLLTEVPAGGSRFSVAPEWNLTFTIVRDMLDASSGAVSKYAKASRWWWEKGYAGDLVSTSTVRPSQVQAEGEASFEADYESYRIGERDTRTIGGLQNR